MLKDCGLPLGTIVRAESMTFSVPFDTNPDSPYSVVMQVHFSPDQEAHLSQIANHTGTDVEQLVREAALRLLEDDTRFRSAVEQGIAAADRGDFVGHEEVWARVEAILQS